MRKIISFFGIVFLTTLSCRAIVIHLPMSDRCAFVTVTNISSFTKTSGNAPGEIVLTSPEITAPIAWDELVASWNVLPGVYLKLEARAIFPDHATKYFTLDEWSDDTALHPRQSVNHQRDSDGNVSIDTLILQERGGKLQLRLTMGSPKGGDPAQIKFLGLSFCDSKTQALPRPANHAAWGKTVEIPERRQGEYEGGGGWCSPTSLSMVLAYWSDKLHRPELNHTVTETAHAIHDSTLVGTGNWPFNTAYAGAYPGMKAYVARFDDISELEDWIAAGFAPIISVSSFINIKHTGEDSGHLIVCVGFTDTGDVIVNDPGVSVKKNVRARQIYPRQHLIDCWKKSKNAVYLIYPVDAAIPKNVSGHWDSGN
jgi:Peptidase_C39 like family